MTDIYKQGDEWFSTSNKETLKNTDVGILILNAQCNSFVFVSVPDNISKGEKDALYLAQRLYCARDNMWLCLYWANGTTDVPELYVKVLFCQDQRTYCAISCFSERGVAQRKLLQGNVKDSNNVKKQVWACYKTSTSKRVQFKPANSSSKFNVHTTVRSRTLERPANELRSTRLCQEAQRAKARTKRQLTVNAQAREKKARKLKQKLLAWRGSPARSGAGDRWTVLQAALATAVMNDP